jgi:hypothetical protein
LLSGVEIIEQKDHHQADEQPESDIFVKRTQTIIHQMVNVLKFSSEKKNFTPIIL